jgi:hypothetical protein
MHEKLEKRAYAMTLVTVTGNLQTSQKPNMKEELEKTVKTVTNMRRDWFLSFPKQRM